MWLMWLTANGATRESPEDGGNEKERPVNRTRRQAYYMVTYPVTLYRTRCVVLSSWRYHYVVPHAAISSPIMLYRNQCGAILYHMLLYYMEESVLLETKPLVDSIRHFIRDPSGVFSVCYHCECRIVQWRHDSRLLLLLNWFFHIMKRTLHVGSKIWILCSRGKNNISLVRCAHSWDIVLAART